MSNINTTYALFEVQDYKNESVLSSFNLDITPLTFKADLPSTEFYSDIKFSLFHIFYFVASHSGLAKLKVVGFIRNTRDLWVLLLV